MRSYSVDGRAGAAALPALFLASLALAGAPSPRPDDGRPAYARTSESRR